MLNISVELSWNLDPVRLISGIGTPLLKNLIQLLSGSIGWGAFCKSVALCRVTVRIRSRS